MIGGSMPPPIHRTGNRGPWPECLGIDGEKCAGIIEASAYDMQNNVFLLHPGEMYTEDFRTDRVRVFVDEYDIVFKVPKLG